MGPLETNAFPEKTWRPSVKSFVRRCCFVGFSVGHSGLCLAEEGGSNGTIGSRTVPRKSSEPVRGTISADDDVLFDINTSPEFVMEQSVFFLVVWGRATFLIGASWRKQWSQWKRKGVPPRNTGTLRGTISIDDAALFVVMTGLAAETGGNKGAIGSKGIPREFCELVRGTSGARCYIV